MTETSVQAPTRTEGTPRVETPNPTPAPEVERAREVAAARKEAAQKEADAFAREQAARSAAASTAGARMRSAYAEFTVNHETHHVSVRIVDANTKEVIREVPPEETQRMAEALREYAAKLAQRRAAVATVSLGL